MCSGMCYGSLVLGSGEMRCSHLNNIAICLCSVDTSR